MAGSIGKVRACQEAEKHLALAVQFLDMANEALAAAHAATALEMLRSETFGFSGNPSPPTALAT